MKNLIQEIKESSIIGTEREIKVMSLKKLIDKFRKNDLKSYHRLKLLFYYFPSIYENTAISDIEIAIKFPRHTYITLDKSDYRYKFTDDIFKKKPYGIENFSGGRYITVNDLFDYFKL